ncbi:hypothetical protein D9M73_152430 [compost metagenome]
MRQPCQARKGFDPFGGVSVAGGAAQHPALDAVEDRGQAEVVEGQVKVPIGDAVAAGAGAIGRDIGVLAGQAERDRIGAAQPGDDVGRHGVKHCVIREIGQRMAERRQFPVEHGEDARLGWMEDQIVDAKVAMDDAGLVIGGDGTGQPRHECVHRGVAPGQRICLILLAPAPDLPREIAAGTPESAEPDSDRIEPVQGGDDAVHFVIKRRAGGAWQVGEAGVPEDAAFDQFHHVKGAADDRLIGANGQDSRHGDTRLRQRLLHLRLAQHVMGTF